MNCLKEVEILNLISTDYPELNKNPLFNYVYGMVRLGCAKGLRLEAKYEECNKLSKLAGQNFNKVSNSLQSRKALGKEFFS